MATGGTGFITSQQIRVRLEISPPKLLIIQDVSVILSVWLSYIIEICHCLRSSCGKVNSLSNGTTIRKKPFCSGGKILQLYSRAIEAEAPQCVVIPDRADRGLALPLRKGDIEFSNFISGQPLTFDSIKCRADAHLNILFSSGTTGTPKAIPWTHATLIKSVSARICSSDGIWPK